MGSVGSPGWKAGIGRLMVAAVLVACGANTVIEGGGGSAAAGGAAGSGGTGGSGLSGGPGQPPPPPDDGVPGDGPGHSFVFTKLLLGDTNRDGSPSPSAWEQYGYNLDGKISTEHSTDLCQPYPGASLALIYPDGDEGTDNAFGKVIMSLITSFEPDASLQIDQAITAGQYSYLIDIDDLGGGPSYLGLASRAYEGSLLGQIPAFDGSDSWPVTAESLGSPPDLSSALFQFPSSYVNGHTWVSSPPGHYEIRLFLMRPMVLSIEHAIITMELSADRSSGSNGVIAGILEVEPLVEEFRKLAGSFDESFCGGSTFDALADSIRQAADILSDGSQDPNQTCDAISLGLGFEASAVQLGAVAAPAPPPADPCE